MIPARFLPLSPLRRLLIEWICCKQRLDHDPKRDGLLIEWYDGLPSPSNYRLTDLEVRLTALTQ